MVLTKCGFSKKKKKKINLKTQKTNIKQTTTKQQKQNTSTKLIASGNKYKYKAINSGQHGTGHNQTGNEQEFQTYKNKSQ
jgi:hypothetical protein